MNSELQNKLINLNVEPPAEVWNKIAVSLDEKIPDTLAQKLFQYEETPPEAAWLNITQQLKTVTEHARVVPIRRRRTAGLVAAAVVLIAAGVTATFLINKKSEPQLPAQNTKVAPSLQNNSPRPEPVTSPNIPIRNANNLPKPHKPLIASTSMPARKRNTVAPDAPMVTSYLPRSASMKDFTTPAFSADKYMIYSDDDGNAVRLPKKIFAAYVCPDENDACKQRLQQLREKFAESAVTADFTGLLEILKSLQENQ